ncbi:uncharacterized protein LOC129766773 [Toxorhynchites rutilus septentrionalis]|uniref:uncharacterized protein LOC129766773 n=1 Tax=Toxorhynchites rutilus septentrionalis TaxID=329112 RepID=UPI0024796F9B|nr:uncharacterized protein LOC129766773 [Toxorhynchites rutilus septentrionalis]
MYQLIALLLCLVIAITALPVSKHEQHSPKNENQYATEESRKSLWETDHHNQLDELSSEPKSDDNLRILDNRTEEHEEIELVRIEKINSSDNINIRRGFACLFVFVTALPTKDQNHDAKPTERIPKYHFEYGVKDANTGDHKVHWEKRNGNHVEGSYTVEEADGGRRIVNYQTDEKGAMQIQVTKVAGHAVVPKPKPLQEQVAGRDYGKPEYPKLYEYYY